jgi:hypothetical protein
MDQVSKEAVDQIAITKAIRINMVELRVNIILEKTVKHGVIETSMVMMMGIVLMTTTVIGGKDYMRLM